MTANFQRTVTVYGGPYATVRAAQEAQRIWGPTVTVRGLISIDRSGRRYTFEVVDRQEATT